MKAAPSRSKARSDARKPVAAKKVGVALPKANVARLKPSTAKPAAAAKTSKAPSKPGKEPKPTVATSAKASKPVASAVASPPKSVPSKSTPSTASPPTPRKTPVAKAALAKAAPAKAPAKALTKAAAAKAAAESKLAPAAAPKPARKSVKEAAGVSSDAVARRTGKSWDGWFEVLDSAGAANLDQRGVIAILAQKHGIGPWWQQMIAVGYEAVRGSHEKPPAVEGFDISSSRTLNAPTARVFRLWNDSSERARWLADDRFVIRTASAGKSIHARWGKGGSHVAISFVDRAGRTEVSVQHQQIESRSAAEHMKSYWAKKLGLLEQILTPSPKT